MPLAPLSGPRVLVDPGAAANRVGEREDRLGADLTVELTLPGPFLPCDVERHAAVTVSGDVELGAVLLVEGVAVAVSGLDDLAVRESEAHDAPPRSIGCSTDPRSRQARPLYEMNATACFVLRSTTSPPAQFPEPSS